ncbi:hypothetical protein Daus18300_001478 [Diaporthe australafricana]|uniref:Pentatricopeptide repeat domain-containing protein n=1 Tax=Diaporthe australafricana TaxID=127596 RepID=A0ABR3XWU1_9PEZI
MIATRSVECGRSALHHSSQLHSRLRFQFAALHSSALKNNTITNNNNKNNHCRHNTQVSCPLQQRHAHTSVPFGWTGLDEAAQKPPEPPRSPAGGVRLRRRPIKPIGAGPLLPSGDAARPGSIPYYYSVLEALLGALRRGDTFKLYTSLVTLVLGNETEDGAHAFAEVVASIPATTFSEVLRSFDPHNVAEGIDTAPGLNISYGVAIHTPLGELVNKWGVKTLYVRILQRLLRIQRARRQAGFLPLLNDYVVLMRCAGATSDVRAAKDVWLSMDRDTRSQFRHSEVYAEFIKARYLTEKIYANNDLARLRLRPLDMHRSSTHLPGKARIKLRHLSASLTDRRRHRFGSNSHERFFDEPLTKLLRNRGPLLKLERVTTLRGMEFSGEELVCALLKANGRTGRVEANRRLFEDHWGIKIHRDKTTGEVSIKGGHTYPLESPRAPTAALLDAIVHSYCSMGEIVMAVRLVDFMSQNYGIPVPDQVWSDLIEYTRLMHTTPVANEWDISELPHKGAKAFHVLEVWSLCTQAPHSFQPQARDYYNLIKSLVKKGQSMLRPIEALRQIKPLYDGVVDDCEQAWCELMQTTQQTVPNHKAFRRYKLLQARRAYTWYMFHYSIRQILTNLRPGRIDDLSAVKEIPKLLCDFEQFLPRKVSYSIATGVVEFRSDTWRRNDMVEVSQLVSRPQPRPDDARATQEDGDRDETDEDWQDDDVQADEVTPARWESEAAVEEEDDDSTYFNMSQWVVEERDVEKPAYLYRPLFGKPSDQASLLELRRSGGAEFTGYHHDPLRQHFAAHRLLQTSFRVIGVPVDLVRVGDRKKRRAKMVNELMRMRM